MINVGFPNVHDRAHDYEGKYLTIHSAYISIGCYATTGSGIDETFQFVTGALAFGQSNTQVSIYPFHMTDADIQCRGFSYYKDSWAQLKPGYDYFE